MNLEEVLLSAGARGDALAWAQLADLYEDKGTKGDLAQACRLLAAGGAELNEDPVPALDSSVRWDLYVEKQLYDAVKSKRGPLILGRAEAQPDYHTRDLKCGHDEMGVALVERFNARLHANAGRACVFFKTPAEALAWLAKALGFAEESRQGGRDALLPVLP